MIMKSLNMALQGFFVLFCFLFFKFLDPSILRNKMFHSYRGFLSFQMTLCGPACLSPMVIA